MQLTRSIRRHESLQPHAVATRCAGRTRTWAELASRLKRVASGLRGLGIRADDRVAILALNADYYMEAMYAITWAGGVWVPLNTRWSIAENVYGLDDSGATVLIVDAHFSDAAAELASRCAGVRAVIQTEGVPKVAAWHAYEDMVAHNAPCEDARRDGDELAGIFYTGGTTGVSKGVMLSHRALITSALATTAEVGYDESTVMLHIAPMFHIADASNMVATNVAGGSHVMRPSFDPLDTLATIEREGITLLPLVPTMLKMLVDHPQVDAFNLSSMRCIIYGGSSITESLLETALTRFRCRFVQLYGQTEFAPASMLAPRHHCLSGPDSGHLKSAGKPFGIAELAILGPGGEPLPRGQVGEITVSGAVAMLGYWKKPEETAKALVDGWVRTGDAGYLDADGFLHVVDRIKDMIISGGENVYSAEVENALSKHPAVAQCAVIGVPDAKWGESVLAVVIPREGMSVTADELIEHCRGLIARYKCPRQIEFRRTPFPATASGKILKRVIRQDHLASGTPA
ncbi:long-chain fatty acid--CoA ligase [Hydrogenophaga sp. YM1]|uniref:acyl-CoA synthetase n=1 Tax=Hydrogenophaga sp. YM1 TaxID=2806262 RepID=UPI0019587A1E|nr:long-chain fatty acid--CoA ligase [Hydrogenophaga sp. YM1]QRR33998.1 long-chain fatty acid--CoA ligase [Hydrogenophaga sp. YM1]